MLTLIIAAAIQPIRTASAAADGRQYARADSRDVYLCKKMDKTTALFAIPYTYCVEILMDHGDWYLVRYAEDDGFYKDITGYCLKKGLTPIDILPEKTYLNFPVTAVLKANIPEDNSLPGLEITVTVAYYGVYYNGAAEYSYVLYNGEFSYVPGANDDYPLNEIPTQPAFSANVSEPQESSAKLITAILITSAAAAAVVVLVLTGKRKAPKSK